MMFRETFQRKRILWFKYKSQVLLPLLFSSEEMLYFSAFSLRQLSQQATTETFFQPPLERELHALLCYFGNSFIYNP